MKKKIRRRRIFFLKKKIWLQLIPFFKRFGNKQNEKENWKKNQFIFKRFGKKKIKKRGRKRNFILKDLVRIFFEKKI